MIKNQLNMNEKWKLDRQHLQRNKKNKYFSINSLVAYKTVANKIANKKKNWFITKEIIAVCKSGGYTL